MNSCECAKIYADAFLYNLNEENQKHAMTSETKNEMSRNVLINSYIKNFKFVTSTPCSKIAVNNHCYF